MLKHLHKNYTGSTFTKIGLFLSKSHVNIGDNYVAYVDNLSALMLGAEIYMRLIGGGIGKEVGPLTG